MRRKNINPSISQKISIAIIALISLMLFGNCQEIIDINEVYSQFVPINPEKVLSSLEIVDAAKICNKYLDTTNEPSIQLATPMNGLTIQTNEVSWTNIVIESPQSTYISNYYVKIKGTNTCFKYKINSVATELLIGVELVENIGPGVFTLNIVAVGEDENITSNIVELNVYPK